MAKKMSPTELYWNAQIEIQIKGEYKEYLEEENLENNPDSAQIFAIRKIDGNYKYHGKSERELILLLTGDLPYMYD